MDLPAIDIQIKTLPESPGVYQYFNAKDTVIYVGKAKNLKKRVNSYFTKQHLNNRTRMLVKNILKVEHIVV
ncbi:MAG: GIY-YIG nuclease family protein, partial [Flavobacteriales bacterium]|nr:GIY-YIG nuclease family protein [Flavobacteriales bacterium]